MTRYRNKVKDKLFHLGKNRTSIIVDIDKNGKGVYRENKSLVKIYGF